MSKSIYFDIFFSLSAKTCQNYSGDDDDGTQKLECNISFLKKDFATDDSDDTGTLFYKSHDCDLAGRVPICNEQRLIANYKHNRQSPHPAVFCHRKTEFFFFYQQVDYVIQDDEQHVPELKLRACNVLHKDFVHEAGEGIE